MVYLIDDDESVRRALQRLFRSAGLDVRAFASAEEFLEIENLSQGAYIVPIHRLLLYFTLPQ